MSTSAAPPRETDVHPVDVRVEASTRDRNRLTTAFRLILAIPHILLVGGPLVIALSWSSSIESGFRPDWGAGGGVLGAVAAVAALIAWFALIFTGRYPDGLRKLMTFYLRWRVRAVAYTALLRDEYPPFGDEPYPAELEIRRSQRERNRLTIAFRLILAIPHLLAVWALGIAWGLSTVVAWFSILFTGEYPEGLYRFAVGVLRWNVRVEAYLLLLHDEYPPFTLD